MLLALQIRDFAIIDELELDLKTGMTVLTGETGAGKSILFDALGFLLGDRADATVVRHDRQRCDICASFDLKNLPLAQDWLEENDLANQAECQLRRVIYREGRSRAYINGSSVPLQSLRTIGAFLVDIHGQHEHQSLMRYEVQRQLLDQYGGLSSQEEKRQDLYQQWKSNQQEIRRITGSEDSHVARTEFLNYQIQELEDLAAQPDEVTQLHRELARLSSAGTHIETINQNIDLLYDEEHSAYNQLNRAMNDLEPLAGLDSSVTEACSLINNAVIQLQEATDLLRGRQDQFELDPKRQDWVERRLDALHKVARKHRIEPEQLTEFEQTLRCELQKIETAEQQLETLEKQQQQLLSSYKSCVTRLHKARKKTALQLSEKVSECMQTLGLEGGSFNILLGDDPESGNIESGAEKIRFLIATNPGQPLGSLTKIASGGELSRISLAIQVVAAKATSIPTMLFDEVDSGVGGAVAETVGRQLKALAAQHQVLCVTHLPQVATQAHQHLKILKTTRNNVTSVHIEPLFENTRVDEIARMLAGQKITAPTLEHARDLIQSAQA